MKLLIILLMALSMGATGQTFYKRTQHKPIKRMTTRQVQEAVKGRTLYERHGSTVVKNNRTSWSTVSKPSKYRPYWHDSRDRKLRDKMRMKNQLIISRK